MNYYDAVQVAGSALVAAGYVLVGRSARWTAAALTAGCAVWAYWCTLVDPFPWGMFVLELVLCAISAHNLRKTWREA